MVVARFKMEQPQILKQVRWSDASKLRIARSEYTEIWIYCTIVHVLQCITISTETQWTHSCSFNWSLELSCSAIRSRKLGNFIPQNWQSLQLTLVLTSWIFVPEPLPFRPVYLWHGPFITWLSWLSYSRGVRQFLRRVQHGSVEIWILCELSTNYATHSGEFCSLDPDLYTPVRLPTTGYHRVMDGFSMCLLVWLFAISRSMAARRTAPKAGKLELPMQVGFSKERKSGVQNLRSVFQNIWVRRLDILSKRSVKYWKNETYLYSNVLKQRIRHGTGKEIQRLELRQHGGRHLQMFRRSRCWRDLILTAMTC